MSTQYLDTLPRKGDTYLVSFKYKGCKYDVFFYCNREDGSTLKTTSWPTGLPALEPGLEFVRNCYAITKIALDPFLTSQLTNEFHKDSVE